MPSRPALLLLLAALALLPAGLTAQPIPLSEPFRISPPFQGGPDEEQYVFDPGVTALASGGFATAWGWTERQGYQTVADGLDGRLLDPTGLGAPSFGITSTSNPYEVHMECPALAPIAGGGFVVVESELRYAGRDLVLALFDAEGTATGEVWELRYLGDDLGDACPSVAPRPDGGFVLAWPEVHYSGVDQVRTVTQSFDAAGQPLGPESYLDELATGEDWTLPDVGTDAQGRAVVVWCPPGGALRAQRLDSAGAPLGDPIVVAESSLDHHAVAVAPDGSFTVAWAGPAPQAHALLLRRFTADGTPLGPPVEVARVGEFLFPTTAVDRHGNIVLGWSDHLLLINRSLVPQGPPVPAGDWWSPLTMNGDGRILKVWAEGAILGRLWQARREADLCLARGRLFLCDTAGDGGTAEVRAFGRGLPSDIPLLGDLDGDGRADPSVWRNGFFLGDTAQDGGTAEVRLRFGRRGDTPLLGDLDGDGRDDPCVWRSGRFLCDTGHDGGTAEQAVAFGPAGVPLLADVDGDGRADPCVWRRGPLLCDTAHNGGQAEVRLRFHPEGSAGGAPLLEDVDGDRRADLCLLREATLHCGHFSATGGAPLRVTVRPTAAQPGDLPLLGDLDAF